MKTLILLFTTICNKAKTDFARKRHPGSDPDARN
jgi:hypothetical protein